MLSASGLPNKVDQLVKEIKEEQWDIVKQIVKDKPNLINEKYNEVVIINRIILGGAPEDVILDMFKYVDKAAVDDIEHAMVRTTLHQLARFGYIEALRQTLSLSSQYVNLKDMRGDTPLHLLLQKNKTFAVHRDGAIALLKCGADINIKNKEGETPTDLYMRNKCNRYEDENKEEQKKKLLQILRRIPAEILARGPEALKAFRDALAEGQTEVNEGRIVVIGLERVGKTSVINSLLRKPFNQEEEITDAMATTKVCTHDPDDETLWEETSQNDSSNVYENAVAEAVAKQMLNSGEQEEENAAAKLETKDEQTVDESSKWSKIKRFTSSIRHSFRLPKRKKKVLEMEGEQQIPQNEDIPEDISEIVVKKVTDFRREKEINSHTDGKPFVMNVLDFGGQPMYHVIHRIFMITSAVVCVVFNLMADLDALANIRDPTTDTLYSHRMTNLQFIHFWIRSVYTQSKGGGEDNPHVLLIGTHLNSLGENDEERNQKFEEISNKVQQSLEGKPYEAIVLSTIFAIENSLPFGNNNGSSIIKQILEIAKKMIRPMPIKWLRVQKEIQLLKKDNIYLPTSEIIDLVVRLGESNFKVLLEYLHDIGEILYYPDNECLKHLVVLDLMRLVDMFKTIITVIDAKLQNPIFKNDWRNLNSGILMERLLKDLWKNFCDSEETFNFFVSLMQKFGLVCEKKSTKDDGRIFYVLSRLKPEHIDRKPIFHNGKGAISLFHGFAGYLPDDFFQRAATKFIEKFQMEDIQPELSFEHVELDVDEHHHVILDVVTIKHRRMFQTTIARRKIINTDRPTEDEEPLPSFCQEVLRFLETELQVFSPRGARGVELKMYIPCVCSNDAHMHVVRKFDKDVLPCGSNGMEVTRYRKLFGETVPSQAVLQSQLELTKPNGYVDDIIIAQVSEEIGLCWKIFGVRLGHKWSKLNSLGNERQIAKATEYMLKQWRSKRSGDNQIAVLCSALKQHGLKDLASRYQNDTGYDSTPQIIVKNSDNFDDQDLLFICENLGSGWRRLALRLGAKWTDLNDIADQHRHVKDRIMNALDSWRQRQPANQIPTMINALRHEHNNLAKLLCTRHDYKFDVAFKDKPVTEDHSRQGSLSDLDFLVISEMMEKDWKSFLRHLGIKQTQLAQIEVKFPGDIVGQTIESLVRWRNGQDSDVNQVEKVKEVLKAEERMDIVEKLEAAERNRDA